MSPEAVNMTEVESVRAALLGWRDSSEETPFGPEVLVYKVRGKVFALLAWLETPLTLSLKCDPVHSLQLREQYAAITPGYHLNKRHWNTIVLDGSVPAAELLPLIDESWRLAARGLKKDERVALGLA